MEERKSYFLNQRGHTRARELGKGGQLGFCRGKRGGRENLVLLIKRMCRSGGLAFRRGKGVGTRRSRAKKGKGVDARTWGSRILENGNYNYGRPVR